jgi:ribonuclease H2 subunit C
MNTDLHFKRPCDNSIHLLPCSIDHDGPAPVKDFFHPQHVEGQAEPVLEATLRGRLLRGRQVELPKGIRGIVLQQSTPPRSRELEHQNYAKEKSTYSNMVYWNHDAAPTEGDYLPQALKIFDVAKSVHNPIPIVP